jgi:dolichol-phosphate mannosyltransferase
MPTATPRIVVVMPTYNEAENLPLMADALFSLGIEHLQLLVVDDNSPDGTGQIAEHLAQQYPGRVFVLHRAVKEGLGPAYRAGLRHALDTLGPDQLLQMDADFSHQPKYIPQMLAAIDGADMVIGSRYVAGGSVDHSWGAWRKALSYFANRMYVPGILGMPYKEATGAFRLWRRDALEGMGLDRLRSSGYVFQVEVTYVAHRLGYRIVEVPIHFPDRTRGQSKMTLDISGEAALRTWQILLRHRHLSPSDRIAQAAAHS